MCVLACVCVQAIVCAVHLPLHALTHTHTSALQSGEVLGKVEGERENLEKEWNELKGVIVACSSPNAYQSATTKSTHANLKRN